MSALKHKKKPYVVLNVALTIVFLVFLVTASTFFVLAMKPIYTVLVDLLKIPETSGYSREVCLRNYSVLIDYNMFWGPKVLDFPDLVMSMRGAIHFKEVKEIFVVMQYAAMGSLVLLVPGILLANKKKTYWWRKAAIIAALVIIAVVGAGLVFNWEGTFTLMHKLLFNNDYWIFSPAEDPVINILPDEVFLTDAALILSLMALGLIAAGIVYAVRTGKERKAHARPAKNASSKERSGKK